MDPPPKPPSEQSPVSPHFLYSTFDVWSLEFHQRPTKKRDKPHKNVGDLGSPFPSPLKPPGSHWRGLAGGVGKELRSCFSMGFFRGKWVFFPYKNRFRNHFRLIFLRKKHDYGRKGIPSLDMYWDFNLTIGHFTTSRGPFSSWRFDFFCCWPPIPWGKDSIWQIF